MAGGNSTQRFAYLGFPHLGGTFTVYRHLREGLAQAGVEVRWLGTGAAAQTAFCDPAWAGEKSRGQVVGPGEDYGDTSDATLAIVHALEKAGYDGVFVNVLTSPAEMSAVRYLRTEMLRIMIVHNITPGTYAAARAIREHVHATIGVSPRIRNDLVQGHGFSPERCVAIANAVAPSTLTKVSPRPLSKGRLRLLYLGRVEDAAKGVFWLPKILTRLNPTISLTVAGDGPDLPELRKRCGSLQQRVRFCGAIPPEHVADLLSEHDALLAPSRFEGLPMTLLEAMAAGCVPIASRITGVTDVVVDHGRSGLLFRVGDVREAARSIARLVDSSLLSRMSAAAIATVTECFTTERMAAGYLRTIAAISAAPPRIAHPLNPDQWALPRGMRPGLRTFLPGPMKNALRVARERLAG